MKTQYNLLLVMLLLPLLVASTANAQDENQKPNKLSIGIFGGITQGHMNIGTEYDPTFGFNLRYAANPTMAVQTNFTFGTMTTHPEDDNYYDREFENSYVTTSMSSQIDILRLLGSTSEHVKLYTNVGLGLIFSDVTTSVNNQVGDWEEFIGEDHTEPAMFATFGPGVRFNLGRRIDLFAQYDYYISNSELIDGFRTRPETEIDLHRRTPDNWSSITAGIQIKFGSSDTDADWHEYDPSWASQDDIDRLDGRINDLDGRVADNTSRLDEQQNYLEMLEERMDEFEDRLSRLEQLVEEQDRTELTIGSDILFAFDSSVIRESAKPTLARVVRALANNPDETLHVVGHTCDIGTEEYNQGLSERRAASVKEYLVNSGISTDRITTEGFGETDPLVPNESEAARQLNRRVELTIE